MLRRCLIHHVATRNVPTASRLSRRRFHASPASRLFGISLPTPSNEPLAGTGAGDGSIPLLFILEVIIGLPAVLWAYKCLMLVAFQRKIIYLPSVPPGTRKESLSNGDRTKDRDSSLSGMKWEELHVESSVPTRFFRRKVTLKGIELSWTNEGKEENAPSNLDSQTSKVVVIYLQGNAGTPLLRIPLFRQLLRPDHSRPPSSLHPSRSFPSTLNNLSIFAVAPRAFWLSTRSTPTEATVLADYHSALEHAYQRHGPSAKYVLYGHSLGGAASILLLERFSVPPFASQPSTVSSTSAVPPISGLILENPLPSIPYMVKALYPQKWLPYHYLGFAAFDRWDAIGRLEELSNCNRLSFTPETIQGGGGGEAIPSLWIRSGRDEIIPTGEEDGVREMWKCWEETARRGRDSDEVSSGEWVEVESALHDTAFTERKWRDKIRSFLGQVASQR